MYVRVATNNMRNHFIYLACRKYSEEQERHNEQMFNVKLCLNCKNAFNHDLTYVRFTNKVLLHKFSFYEPS